MGIGRRWWMWATRASIVAAVLFGCLVATRGNSDARLVDPLAALSDDFEDSSSLRDWLLLSNVDRRPALHDTIDIAVSVPGALTIDPNTWRDPQLPARQGGVGWFQDEKGPFLFKLVRGNFVVTTRVAVGTKAALSTAPTGTFNAGGIVARDPSSTAHQSGPDIGDERWVMYNIGNQDGRWASEAKTTFPATGSGRSSRSSLFLAPIPALSGRLSMCRIGNRFHFFRQIDGAPGGWVQDVPDASTMLVNNAGLPSNDIGSGFVRPDLPETLQVGLIANRWTDGDGSPIRAVFHEITFAAAASLADCTPR